jgi:hypothetical protein
MDYQVFHKDNALYQTLATNNPMFKEALIENRDARKKISKEKSDTSKMDPLNEVSGLKDKTNIKKASSTKRDVRILLLVEN